MFSIQSSLIALCSAAILIVPTWAKASGTGPHDSAYCGREGTGSSSALQGEHPDPGIRGCCHQLR
jgi:hypothetical protein